MNDLWQEICFMLQYRTSLNNEELYEQIYEQKIIQVLEKLGWSLFRKEIMLQKPFQWGSVGTLRPDIIVKSLDNGESFVIEVKKPSVDIQNESHKNQLFSYMRQLKSAHGLLIGNKIQLYYDGRLNKLEEPTLLLDIDLSESNSDGLLFIKLFCKDSFSYNNLERFADESFKERKINNDRGCPR